MHTGARAHACTPCHTCTHTFHARTSASTAHTSTQRTPPLTRAYCTRARVRTHALPRHARPGLGPFGRERRGASGLNLQAPSALRPAPGLEPERDPRIARSAHGACAKSRRTDSGHAQTAPRAPRPPQHPQFQAQGRVRKSVERIFVPRPLIRFKPLPFPQEVPSLWPTVRGACRLGSERRPCFVSGGIWFSERCSGLPRVPPSL